MFKGYMPLALFNKFLELKCPLWTEDADFFGAGVATWTTDHIELLLRDARPSESGFE
jgi:hypothetical protein